MIFRIEAPHFVAGLDIGEDEIGKNAAPIIKYMNGWHLEKIQTYCSKKGWFCQLIKTKEKESCI